MPLPYTSQFCDANTDPFDVVWTRRDAVIRSADSTVIFHQCDVEAPEFWSQRAVNIVASKYFRGQLGTPQRETSVRQVIQRVVDTIWKWGMQQHYFTHEDHAAAFRRDLTYLLVHQIAAFNSPVWFNLGVEGEKHPQISACFIQGVQDDMASIAQLQQNEATIFKGGSGSGVNFSPLRSSKEPLQGGGFASGPVSFMRGFDSWAGIIKSGGKTRRAAAIRILNGDHPDILEFVQCKSKEEKKAQALIAQGYSKDFSDPEGAYASVAFQNANHSVRLTDTFMELVIRNPQADWELKSTSGKTLETIPVHELWNAICQAAWESGDPGIQFDSTTNAWNTCSASGRINGTNPCGEFAFLDDSACNLASINLVKLLRGTPEEGVVFDYQKLIQVTRTLILAQDILVAPASYPTHKIESNSLAYRPLGLGFTNLGALLMLLGLPYDSDEGRSVARGIASTMTATAYQASAELAHYLKPFPEFHTNRNAMLAVIQEHLLAAERTQAQCTEKLWDRVYAAGAEHGFRNAQVTLLAPTGTIGFMMDCDTLSCEPENALIKTKLLVGGGSIQITSTCFTDALKNLRYTKDQIRDIEAYLNKHHFLDDCPTLQPAHLPIFDCALGVPGKRTLSATAHINMVAALQPFLSGAISKTINMPADATVEDVSSAFKFAWVSGLKSITIYRDGCKQSQPIVVKASTAPAPSVAVADRPLRKKLRDTQHNACRIKFHFGDTKGFMVVTPYEDTGMPGEVFVVLSKSGSTIQGLVDGWATALSYSLQYGVPLEVLAAKFAHTKFEPAGWSADDDIKYASSIYDALVRKLAAVFIRKESTEESRDTHDETPAPQPVRGMDCPPCANCGSITQRLGTCYQCPSCGTSSGSCGG